MVACIANIILPLLCNDADISRGRSGGGEGGMR